MNNSVINERDVRSRASDGEGMKHPPCFSFPFISLAVLRHRDAGMPPGREKDSSRTVFIGLETRENREHYFSFSPPFSVSFRSPVSGDDFFQLPNRLRARARARTMVFSVRIRAKTLPLAFGMKIGRTNHARDFPLLYTRATSERSLPRFVSHRASSATLRNSQPCRARRRCLIQYTQIYRSYCN